MIPWQRLDSAHIPGGGELRLMRRGPEFAIKLGSNELKSFLAELGAPPPLAY